jgi:hypothetical protein
MFAAGLELECKYENGRCSLHGDGILSKRIIGESFTISGSPKEKKATNHVAFSNIGKVAHLPTEICQEFPKLVKLSIEWSNIPLLKKDLFKPACKKVRELLLSNNGIKIIEEEAFKHLTKLIVIKLDHNKIRSVDQKLFQYNLKLEEIDLSHNYISLIDPKTFDNLNRLKAVNLQHYGWTCIGQKRNCPDYCEAIFNYAELKSRGVHGEGPSELKTCIGSYRRNMEWMEEGDFY